MGSKIGGYPQTGDLQNSNFLTFKAGQMKFLGKVNYVNIKET